MDFYLDDCADSDRLALALEHLGHRVVTARQAGKRGQSDAEHFRYAVDHQLVLITGNPRDFRDLSEEWRDTGRRHPGVLLICRDRNPAKDMNAEEVAEAVKALLDAGLPLSDEVHVLNHWRQPGRR